LAIGSYVVRTRVSFSVYKKCSLRKGWSVLILCRRIVKPVEP